MSQLDTMYLFKRWLSALVAQVILFNFLESNLETNSARRACMCLKTSLIIAPFTCLFQVESCYNKKSVIAFHILNQHKTLQKGNKINLIINWFSKFLSSDFSIPVLLWQISKLPYLICINIQARDSKINISYVYYMVKKSKLNTLQNIFSRHMGIVVISYWFDKNNIFRVKHS